MYLGDDSARGQHCVFVVMKLLDALVIALVHGLGDHLDGLDLCRLLASCRGLKDTIAEHKIVENQRDRVNELRWSFHLSVAHDDRLFSAYSPEFWTVPVEDYSDDGGLTHVDRFLSIEVDYRKMTVVFKLDHWTYVGLEYTKLAGGSFELHVRPRPGSNRLADFVGVPPPFFEPMGIRSVSLLRIRMNVGKIHETASYWHDDAV